MLAKQSSLGASREAVLGSERELIVLADDNADMREYLTRLLGDRALTDITYFSHGANGSVSRLMGRHTLKAGADYRILGIDALSYGQTAGSFTFNGQFTGSNANNPSATSRSLSRSSALSACT